MAETPLTSQSALPDVDDSDNPLLMDFDFPPFASVEPRHVCPGIRSLLRQLETFSDGYLEELERSVEPTWEKLVEPLEKIVDRLMVVWGMVNHLKAVKDSEDLRAAMDDVQAVKETGQRFRETIPALGGEKAPLEVNLYPKEVPS